MFTLHSLGDPGFLADILNAVAIITGGSDWAAISQVGLLVGALLVSFQALISGGRGINFQVVFVSWLAYAIAFAPKVDVAVESAYDGSVIPVSGVPLGPAVIGHLLGEMGYSITESFEQGFSMPSMTHHGFNSALETIKSLRLASLDPNTLGPSNDPLGQGADFAGSWIEYVQRCTTTSITHGSKIEQNDIINSANFMQSLRFDSSIYMARININGSPRDLECSEAFSALDVFTRTHFLPNFKIKKLARVLRTPSLDDEVSSKIQDALNALGVSASADDVILASVVEPLYLYGKQERQKEDRDFSYTVTVADAIAQRAAQWTAEASLFARSMRPMMTFVEAFTFAITPIMAFLVVIGPWGLTLASKYILLLAWIQLWLPVNAVVSFYTHWSLTQALAPITTNGLPPSSLAGLWELDGIAMRGLETASLMAASVPLLSLILVTGSVFAVTQLTGRMQGSDVIDEKKVAPDTYAPVPLLARSSPLTVDPMRGVHQTGSADTAVRFGVNLEGSTQTAAARQNAVTASETFSRTLGQVIDHAYGSGARSVDSAHFTTGRDGSRSESTGMAYDRAAGIASRYSDVRGLSKETIAAIGADVAGPSGQFKTAGSISGYLQSRHGVSENQAQTMEQDIRRSFSEDKSWNSQYMEKVASDISKGSETYYTSSVTTSETADLRKVANEAVQKSKSYSETAQASASMRSDVSWDGVTAATKVTANPEASDTLLRELQRSSSTPAAEAYYRGRQAELLAMFAGDKERAYTYAGLVTLANANPLADRTSGARNAIRSGGLQSVLSVAMGYSPGAINAPEPLAAEPSFQSGDIRSQVQGAVEAMAQLPSAQGIKQQALSGIQSLGDATRQAHAGNAAHDAYRRGNDVNRAASAPQRREIAGEQLRKVQEQNTQTASPSLGVMAAEAPSTITATGAQYAADLSRSIGNLFRDDVARQAAWSEDWNKHRDWANGQGLSASQAAYYATEKMTSGWGHKLADATGLSTLTTPELTDYREALRNQVISEAGGAPTVADLIDRAADKDQSGAAWDFRGLRAEREAADRLAEAEVLLSGSREGAPIGPLPGNLMQGRGR